MKKIFGKFGIMPAFVAILTAILSFSFVACGDDKDNKDDEPGQITGGGDGDEPSQAAKMMEFSYHIELGDLWWEFFDINVVYNDLKGVEHKETLTDNIVIAGDGPAGQAPEALNLKVTATPKEHMPAIDPDRSYDMSQKIAWMIGTSDGGMLHSSSVSSTLSIRGSKLEGNKILTESRELVNRTFELR